MIVECPLNSLSFGNVSYNILRELYRKDKTVGLFPIGNNFDLTAFPAEDQKFQEWLKEAVAKRWERLDKDAPALRLWHLQDSESRKTHNQGLYTFYECSEPTDVEKAIARNQDRLFFSSEYAADIFRKQGIECEAIPLGFDEDFKTFDVPKPEGIQFGLMGKFEHRKRTAQIIQSWLKRYGNKQGYTLNLCVTNPFFKPEEMNRVLANVLEGKHYNNVNILPYLKTNTDVNGFLNMIDIDLGGLSGGEGWNLPSFNATCMGKWSVVLNATSHKDWATPSNSILVEPKSTFEVHDGVFFKKGHIFNQGIFFDWDEEDFNNAMDVAETKAGQVNTEGVKLSQEFTYEKTTDRLLSGIGAD